MSEQPASEQESGSEPGLSRRGFLVGATSAAAYIALSGSAQLPQSVAQATANGRSSGRSSAIAGQGVARGLAADGEAVVAVGVGPGDEPAVWIARDADSQWEPVDLGDGFRDAELHGIHRKGNEYLILGAVTVHDTVVVESDPDSADTEETYEFTAQRRVPALWRSTDASSWTRHLLGDSVDGNAVLAAAADDGRRLVAVGSRLDADSAESVGALVVYSDDGRTWRQGSFREDDGALVEGGLTDVIAHAGTWAAVGGHIEGGSIWSSSDGASWNVWDAAQETFDDVTLQSIAAARNTLVAATAGVTEPTPAQFTSRDDGATWTPGGAGLGALNRPDATVNDLAVDGDSSLLAVGVKAGAPTLERGNSNVRD